MVILLDLDGVLITTPAWRAVETAADGFCKFNERATTNLAAILAETKAAFVLTTSHRINYSVTQWEAIFKARSLFPSAITKVNNRTTLPQAGSRASEIETWVMRQSATTNYVVVDDDLSLHTLPPAIKSRCVLTKPLVGLDTTATKQVLHILRSNAFPTTL
ncbi:HAD domain-containing protein [Hymenobacter psoromatis]|uniref:HAD domain-containing protein n=1 Tax=Hymenobacter psoromatis TaxID=1484116 RepID=UPI001CBD181E